MFKTNNKKSNMGQGLNKVETTLLVAGAKTHFVSLELNQSFNNHHLFEIAVDFEELDEKWMESPAKIISLIGEQVNISMKQKETGEENLFEGIITQVTMSGYHGQQNVVILSGKSPTIRLDGKETMDSFMDKTLQQIAGEAVSNSGNGGSVICKPVFAGKLDYICQYNETCFELLNRMSWCFGEWFFYNGRQIFFGKPAEGGVTDIYYDIDMTHFDLSAQVIPPKFNRHFYLEHDDKEIEQDAPESVDGVEGYLYKSLDMSKKVYTSEAHVPSHPVVLTKKELEDLVKVEKTRSVGQMLIASGETQTCKVKIGEKIKIKFPSNMEVSKKEVDTFVVTELTHRIDQEGHYSNHFKGILSGMKNIPMDPRPAPAAAPQLAWVTENVDAKMRGRIKVQFQWQKKMNKTTNWIRVQTEDAGYSDVFAKNRGHTFLPEIGDQVVIGFMYGDPNRPYMAGGIFPETKSEGGKIDNTIKSIKTRSGHMVEFNDSEGDKSITITDISGNIIVLDTVGSQIKIHAPKKVTITSEDIEIAASKSLVISSGKDTQQSVGTEFNQTVGENHSLGIGKSMNVKIDEHLKLDTTTGNVNVQAGKEILESAKGNVKITSEKKTDVISQSDITIQSGTNVYIAQ